MRHNLYQKLLADLLPSSFYIEWHQECSSTMDLARQWINTSSQNATGVFLAETQTAVKPVKKVVKKVVKKAVSPSATN